MILGSSASGFKHTSAVTATDNQHRNESVPFTVDRRELDELPSSAAETHARARQQTPPGSQYEDIDGAQPVHVENDVSASSSPPANTLQSADDDGVESPAIIFMPVGMQMQRERPSPVDKPYQSFDSRTRIVAPPPSVYARIAGESASNP